ncbi:MAG: hypothetical protein ACFCVC_01040 [Acidimicrobiia bacterium]
MTSPARALRDAIEPFHSFSYFAAELRMPKLEEAGLHPMAAYFAQRSCPMGAVSGELVSAVFYGFNPALVSKSIPAVWSLVSPSEAWGHRITGVGAALGRMVPGGFHDADVASATALAARAIEGLVMGGRPLGACHAAMPVPADPLSALWHHIAVLREYRGDGHVAALIEHGIGPIESLVTAGSFSNLSVGFHRKRRGWDDDQLAAAVQRCIGAGWVDAEWTLTAPGVELRQSIEDATDRTMAPVLEALGSEGTATLTSLMAEFSDSVVDAGGFR